MYMPTPRVTPFVIAHISWDLASSLPPLLMALTLLAVFVVFVVFVVALAARGGGLPGPFGVSDLRCRRQGAHA